MPAVTQPDLTTSHNTLQLVSWSLPIQAKTEAAQSGQLESGTGSDSHGIGGVRAVCLNIIKQFGMTLSISLLVDCSNAVDWTCILHQMVT